MKIWLVILALGLMNTTAAQALQNRTKHLKSELHKCEKQAKKLADFGYPQKADKKINQCKKIKTDLAKIEKSQKVTHKKLASLKKGTLIAKHKKKKHKHPQMSDQEKQAALQPAEQPMEPAMEQPRDPAAEQAAVNEVAPAEVAPPASN